MYILTYFSLVGPKPKHDSPNTIDSMVTNIILIRKKFFLIRRYRKSGINRDIIGYYAHEETETFSIKLEKRIWTSLEIESHSEHIVLWPANMIIYCPIIVDYRHISIRHCERPSSLTDMCIAFVIALIQFTRRKKNASILTSFFI